MDLLQYTASLTGGQWAVDLLQYTASLPGGQWAVDLLQYTASLPGGQWAVDLLQYTAPLPGGQWAVDLLQYTASLPGGQWAVELLQCTVRMPGGSGQWTSCNTLPHCLGALGSGPPALHCPTAWGQWAVGVVWCGVVWRGMVWYGIGAVGTGRIWDAEECKTGCTCTPSVSCMRSGVKGLLSKKKTDVDKILPQQLSAQVCRREEVRGRNDGD